MNYKSIDNNLCIICLSSTDIKEISKIVTVNKTCKCMFYTHDECINKWVNTNPICPYCKEVINNTCTSATDSGTVIDIPSGTSITDTGTGTSTLIETKTIFYNMCIARIMILLFILLIMGVYMYY